MRSRLILGLGGEVGGWVDGWGWVGGWGSQPCPPYLRMGWRVTVGAVPVPCTDCKQGYKACHPGDRDIRRPPTDTNTSWYDQLQDLPIGPIEETVSQRF